MEMLVSESLSDFIAGGIKPIPWYEYRDLMTF